MDSIFEALASTPRRKILAYLAEAELTAGDIAARFAMARHAETFDNVATAADDTGSTFSTPSTRKAT